MLYHNPNDPNQPQRSDPGAQPGSLSAPQPAWPDYPLPVTPGPAPVRDSAVPPIYQPVYQPGMPTWQPGLPPTQAMQARLPVPGPAAPVRTKARTAALFALTCLLAVVFGAGLFSGWTYARLSASTNAPARGGTSPSPTASTAFDIQAQREAAIAKVSPAVVEIIGQTARGTALGSGVIVDKNGNIITNAHVVEGISQLQVVLGSGTRVNAQLIGTVASNDLAVVRIPPFAGMTVATFGDSSKLTIGQEVLAIGNPLGYSGTVTSGIISALHRDARESSAASLLDLIQTSAAINPGNSGGALVNLQGEVVGIPTLAAIDSETNTPADGIGFAIPSSQVKTVLQQVLG